MAHEEHRLEKLIEQCAVTNDARCWSELVKQLQRIVAGTVVRTGRMWEPLTPEVVEDLSQEAFLKIFRDDCAMIRESFPANDQAIVGFIRAVVANLVHDYYRATRTAKRKPISGFAEDSDSDLDSVVDSRSMDAVEQQVLISEIDRILKARLAGSNAAQRDRRIFWLHHRHGMTAKAISSLASIGLTEKGVESVLLRLRNLLKQEMTT